MIIERCMTLCALLCLGAWGCGASDGGKEHEQTERELAPMHGTLGAFHDVLAPIYHMDKGSERDSRACANVPDMITRAHNVVLDLRSEKNPPFKAAAEALEDRSKDLQTACSAQSGIEAKLEAVHQAFHATLESAHEGEVTHDDKDEAAHGHDTNTPY